MVAREGQCQKAGKAEKLQQLRELSHKLVNFGEAGILSFSEFEKMETTAFKSLRYQIFYAYQSQTKAGNTCAALPKFSRS